MRRRAFTLVELLVVLAVIAALAVLVAVVLPGFQQRSRASKGAQAIQGWLRYAAGRAVYEQAPRGLRFNLEQSAVGLVARSCQYIEKPDDLASPALSIAWTGAGPNPPLDALLTFPYQIASASDHVEPGDYLELFGGGQVRLITSAAASSPTQIKLGFQTPPLYTPLPANQVTVVGQYRIQRKPRPAQIEPVTLPRDVVVDLSATTVKNPLPQGLYSPPVVYDAGGAPLYFDILFSPSGLVFDASGRAAVLWVRLLQDNGSTEFDNNPTILAVYTQGGLAAAYDPFPGDTYRNVK